YLHQNEALNPVGGNTAQLMEDGDQARATMLKDISQAKKEINILYYIWLVDDTGTAMAEAIIAAAHRGVTCRVMVDALGSRRLIRSHYWQEMKAAGVHCEICLPF